jgi:glycine cleavage system H protein
MNIYLTGNKDKIHFPSRREFLKETAVAACGFAACGAGSCRNLGPSINTKQTNETKSEFSFDYKLPAEMPLLLEIPGCSLKIAADRCYSVEHIWILPVTENSVVMGITEKLVSLLSGPYAVDLRAAGSTINRDDTFGSIQGFKISVDLISPVSGTIISVNKELINSQVPFDEQSAGGEHITALANDAYRSGWLVAMKLDSTEELEPLLSPEQYISLNAKID